MYSRTNAPQRPGTAYQRPALAISTNSLQLSQKSSSASAPEDTAAGDRDGIGARGRREEEEAERWSRGVGSEFETAVGDVAPLWSF